MAQIQLFAIICLLLVTATHAYDGPVSVCYGTYISFKTYCFMYYPGFITTNYYAKNTCEGHHGHLVHINSTEKNDALLTFLRHYTSDANVYIDGSRKYNYTDIDYEGEVMTYSNWDSAVPQLTEQCVVLSVKTGTWFLNSCSEYHDYVCEMYW